MNDMSFWKAKLAAYLHDPPSKALDIRDHEERSDATFHCAGFLDREIGDYFRPADHLAAAADRLPFPASRVSGLSCAFDGVRNTFLHPFAGTKMPFHAPFQSAAKGIEGEQTVQPVLTEETLRALPNDAERWRARFFAHWRLWPSHAAAKDYRLAFLPADTRIPDHTIWNHMQVVSALGSCRAGEKGLQPAFLKFQLGPVQEFIAAARSIRDLWSGSYLLSWLMAVGLKELSAEVGPDAVIFPNLRAQPLFDLHWREELWDQVAIGDRSAWESLKWEDQDLLTPNLPNVFLAVVPAARGEEMGRRVSAAIQAEWCRIAGSVWQDCQAAGLTADEPGITEKARKDRFDAQINRFLSTSWQVTPWPGSLQGALEWGSGFPAGTPLREACSRVQGMALMATEKMDKAHRDARYYQDEAKTQLNNPGLGWSVILAQNSWAMDAVRQTRHFSAANAGGWQTGTFQNKDVLNGRDEAVAGGHEWAKRVKGLGGDWTALFKHPDWLGAATLVKRVWHRAYLRKQWGFTAEGFRMPNTRGIAVHDPFAKDPGVNDEEQAVAVEDQPPAEKYFAVLAFDGDEIGKWLSGEKTPKFETQLADYRDGSGVQRYGAKPYFERPEFAGFCQAQRPVSPSYHLQFSEALGNFALRCARRIVEDFDGRLIYAGGDDVLALLPADTALACAQALRRAFQGGEVRGGTSERALLASPASGFLAVPAETDDQKRSIPFLVPGPKADASVGIAIAHFKAPLQDVVRAAQAAEKRAKKQLDRSAVAVNLCKRSGEIIEWGAKWDSGGLELYQALAAALKGDELSAKFPHRLIALLEPYTQLGTVEPYTQLGTGLTRRSTSEDFEAKAEEIVGRDFGTVCERQRGQAFPRGQAADFQKKFADLLKNYWGALGAASKPGGAPVSAEAKIRTLIGLCQTVAFAHRTRGGEDAE